MVALSARGTMHCPRHFVYMDKIVTGPEAKDCIDINAPVAENLKNIALAKKTNISEITVVVLDRPRHQKLLDDIRSAGARVKLISDGDVSASLEAALPDNPTKIAAGGLGRDLSEVASAITQRFSDSVSVVPANEMTFLNITGIKASKPEALRRILGSKQLSLDNVMAFGDDIPDIDMLAACGIPIAVANAVPEVKAVTDYHTESNDKDGVAVALEKMLSGIL